MNRMIVFLIVTAVLAYLIPAFVPRTDIDIVDDAVLYTGVQKEMVISTVLVAALAYWLTDYIVLKNSGNSA